MASELEIEIKNKKYYGSNKIENGEEQVDYDKLLSSAGEFGLYQFLIFLGTFPFYAFGVFVYLSQMFMTEVSPNHWCWIPELANLSVIERKTLAIPKDDSNQFGYSQCYSYVANWTEVLAIGSSPNKTWTITPCQHGWEFDKAGIPYPTISSELGWVCDKGSYQANAQAIFFMGSIFGGFLIGWIADRYGRLPAAVVSNMLGCIGGVLSTFARNFAEFAACRFFMGMAYDNCMMIVYLLVLEYIAPKYKTLIANGAFAIFYSIFVTALPWIVLACGHWKTISLVTSIPLALSLLTPFLMPESPRWLLSKGRIDEAVEKILTIGRINKKEIPPKLIEQFKISALKDTKQESHSILEIFKRPLSRKGYICICLEYMCCTIVFDGLVRSIGQLNFDFFLSFTVISFTEFPSVLLIAFLLDCIGRRWMTIFFMLFCCVFCVLTIFIGSGLPSVICAVIARFSVNMSFSATVQWAPELLPTSVRGSGSSIVHICGYIAAFLSPYIVYLKIYAYWLPLIVIACVAAFGAFLAFLIPETASQPLPQSFEDAEELGRNQKIWDVFCIQRIKRMENSKDRENAHGQENNSFEM